LLRLNVSRLPGTTGHFSTHWMTARRNCTDTRLRVENPAQENTMSETTSCIPKQTPRQPEIHLQIIKQSAS